MILNLAKLPNIPKDLNIEFSESVFPGGEVHFRINKKSLEYDIDILCMLNSSEDIMRLVLAVDAIRRLSSECKRYIKINAFIPYIPYARQDRVCNTGEAHSLKVFCNILNSLKFDKVTCYDPHSDVCEALIDNLEVIKPNNLVKWALYEIFKSESQNIEPNQHIHLSILSPDAGQSKKIYKLDSLVDFICRNSGSIYECSKIRDLKTTKILETKVPLIKDYGPIVIIDDICDGGRTFIETAKEVRKQTEVPLYLIVSHGIFSNGEDELKKLFTKIYTTNSIRDEDIVIGAGIRPVKSSLIERINIFPKV